MTYKVVEYEGIELRGHFNKDLYYLAIQGEWTEDFTKEELLYALDILKDKLTNEVEE